MIRSNIKPTSEDKHNTLDLYMKNDHIKKLPGNK